MMKYQNEGLFNTRYCVLWNISWQVFVVSTIRDV